MIQKQILLIVTFFIFITSTSVGAMVAESYITAESSLFITPAPVPAASLLFGLLLIGITLATNRVNKRHLNKH